MLPLQPLEIAASDLWPKTTEQINSEITAISGIAIPLEQLTTESLAGTGVFDVLMRTTKLHLEEEYQAGRITGKEYTTVYLGALTAVLQQSVQFLTNAQQVYLINAQIGLIRQQTVTELANTDDSIPIGLGFNHVPDVQTTIDSLASLSGGTTWL